MESDARPGEWVPGDAPFKAALERFSQLLSTLLAPVETGGALRDEGLVGPQLVAEIERWLRDGAPLWAACWSGPHWQPFGVESFAQSFGPSNASSFGSSFGLPPLVSSLAADNLGGGDAKHTLKLMTRWFNAQVQLAALWNGIARAACEKFMARVGTTRPSPDLPSIRRLYDLLIDCAEQAYATTAQTHDYCRIQAELINTTAELSLDRRRRAEAVAVAVGLPTQSEIDALRAELTELRASMESALAAMHPQRRSEPRAVSRVGRKRAGAASRRKSEAGG